MLILIRLFLLYLLVETELWFIMTENCNNKCVWACICVWKWMFSLWEASHLCMKVFEAVLTKSWVIVNAAACRDGQQSLAFFESWWKNASVLNRSCQTASCILCLLCLLARFKSQTWTVWIIYCSRIQIWDPTGKPAALPSELKQQNGCWTDEQVFHRRVFQRCVFGAVVSLFGADTETYSCPTYC